MRKVYLSLGSNKNDRQLYLQLAVGLIHYRIGDIQLLSSLVETPAWGFDGNSFYNACLMVETSLPPQALLDELLAIEQYLGRNRTTAKGYQNRNIDLDILFYGEALIELPHLTIPHPRMQLRNFVLAPLAMIAAKTIHPTLGKSIEQLLEKSPDPTSVHPVSTPLFVPKKRKFIAIEGNIGAGKTSFTHQLQAALGGTILLENFYDNPYLADFYKAPEKFALKVETAFFEDRIQQLSSFFHQKKSAPIIADFSMEKSLLFARQNLTKTDFTAYQKDYLKLSKSFPQPECILFLAQDIPQLLHNIKKRGRLFEQDISADYLQKIENSYQKWLDHSRLTTCVLDTKGVDFIKDTKAFYRLLLAFFRN